jgi:hypothetical protein
MRKKYTTIILFIIGSVLLIADGVFFALIKVNHIGEKIISGNTIIVKANAIADKNFTTNFNGFYSIISNRDAELYVKSAFNNKVTISDSISNTLGYLPNTPISNNQDIFISTNEFKSNKTINIADIDYPNDESVLISGREQTNNNAQITFLLYNLNSYLYLIQGISILMFLLSGVLIFINKKHNKYRRVTNTPDIKKDIQKEKTNTTNEFAIENITGAIEKLTPQKIKEMEKSQKQKISEIKKLRDQNNDKPLKRKDLRK